MIEVILISGALVMLAVTVVLAIKAYRANSEINRMYNIIKHLQLKTKERNNAQRR
jgi:hypothetical protein